MATLSEGMEVAGWKEVGEEGRRDGEWDGWKVERRGGVHVMEGDWVGIVSPLEVGMAPPRQVGKASRDGVRKAPPLEVGGGG